jgi:hypothetical protein
MEGSAEDLFFTMGYFESCFQLLKNLQPRVIDDSNNFCLGPRSKGVIVAWVDAMDKGALIVVGVIVLWFLAEPLFGLLGAFIGACRRGR